uniref:Uncharacterized protein n=1 Tax=Arundo donax TaxID=35708 RepID=A0A0A9BIE0_ARUDO
MITDSFVLTNMSNKGALADFPRTNNWQDLKFFRTMRFHMQQEGDGKFCFHLAAKHAVGQLEMHAVRLAVQVWVARQEQDEFIDIKDHGAQIVKRLLEFFRSLSTFTGEIETLRIIYYELR